MGRDFGPACEHSGKITRLFYSIWSVSNVDIVLVNTKEIIRKIQVRPGFLQKLIQNVPPSVAIMNGTRHILEFRLLFVFGFENTSFVQNPKIKYLGFEYPLQRLHVWIH